ncbi:hypothetical protein IWQ62_006537 [Dispira parvispora]|uniref:Uncharacterized protein n=1 Tax=Dispira parvispora TaxID=1520584 RepID=A0A9W8AI86_9FUNG|nr:hypothetical protein IWQ62_006537 [Dispira parvispora]
MLKQAQQKQHWKTQAENCEKLLHGFEKEIISLQQKTRAHISEALEAWTDDDRAKLVDKINALEQENTIQRREIMFLQKNQKYLTSELQSLMDHMTLTFQQHRMEQTTSKRVLQEKEYSLNVVHRLLEEMMGKTRQYDNLREKYRKESAQLKEAMQLSNWNHIIDTIQRMGTDNPF